MFLAKGSLSIRSLKKKSTGERKAPDELTPTGCTATRVANGLGRVGLGSYIIQPKPNPTLTYFFHASNGLGLGLGRTD